MFDERSWVFSGLASHLQQPSRWTAYSLLASLLLLATLSSAAGAISAANRNLAVTLMIELGNNVDAGGRKIQQVNASGRAELAECFAKLRVVAGRLMEAEIERIRGNPYARNQSSQWAPFVALVDVAHAYAIGAPNIQSSLSYVSLKQIEAARDASYKMLKELGWDMSALEGLKRQADELIKNNLQLVLNGAAC
jgi:hypothetical protein